jgi:cytoskeletal protein CcmA (bactofilin family)
MAIFSIIAIGAALLAGGASYVQAKKAQKKAKKLANSMAGVLLNKESNIEPLPVIYGTRRVGGVRVFISTEGATNEYLYIALALCEGPVASIASIEIDGIPITDSRFASTVATQLHYGTDDQVRSALLAGASGWTTDHRLRGVAYISVRLKWDQDVFSGVPEITALVTGKKIYDPRTGNTVWSANPALCIRDYLTNTRYGKGLPDSAIDDVAFSAAADDCDSFSVTPYSGATSDIDLFQCNAVIDTGEEIFRNVEKMLLGCRGFLPYIGGKYGLYIDQSKSPILDLGLDNIIGSISFAGEKKEDKFNRVIVKFANPNTEWQEDAAIWPDAGSTEETTYLAEDGGVLLVDEIDMETITNYYAARDFARIFVLRSRNGMRVSLQATSEAMNLIVGDVIRLTHPTPSFTNKPFQVEQVSLNYDGTVNLDLLEYDSTIYSYDLSSEETSYPDTNLPDPFIVAPPTGLTLTESTRVENDGTIVPSVLIQWSAPVDYFINAYEVQYKLSTDSTYKSRITWSTEFDLDLPQSGATYNIRVRSINTVGARSSNVSSQISIIGDNAAPGVPTNADVNADSKTLIITWDNPSDSDFSYVEIKRSPNTTESNAVVIAKNDGEAYTDGPFSSGTAYYYWLRAVDRSGNASAWVYAGGDTTTGVIEADLPAGALNTSIYRITTNDSAAPSDVEFNTFAGRLPRENDIALTYDTTQTPNVSYAWEYNGSSWVSIPNLISGDLVVDGSITADKITVDNIESLSSDLGDITAGSLDINSGQFVVTSAGDLTAQSATITGNITANTLTLTPSVSISADNLATDNVTLVNSGGQLSIKSGGVDTGQLANGAVTAPIIEEGAVQGKTIALLLNKNSDGTANSGEGSFVGVNNAGEPVPGTDGFVIFDNFKYNIARNQVNSSTFATQVVGKKGFVVYDASGFNFTVVSTSTRTAFVWREDGTWYYDNNTSTGVAFTPTDSMLALAFIETGSADVIQRGGLLAEPVQILRLAEIRADYISAGTLDAQLVTVKNLNAENISTGILSVDRIPSSVVFTSELSDGTTVISGGNILTGEVSADRIDVTGLITANGIITNSATINNDIKIGSGESVFKADSNGIYLGSETFGSAEFRVTPAGALTATSANITGNITASSLTLQSGVTIPGDKVDTDNVTLTASGGNLIVKGGGVNTTQLALRSATDTFRADMPSNVNYSTSWTTLVSITGQAYNGNDIAEISWGIGAHPEASGAPYIAIRILIYASGALQRTQYFIGEQNLNLNTWAQIQQALFSSSMQYFIGFSNSNWQFYLQAATNANGTFPRQFRAPGTYMQIVRLKR